MSESVHITNYFFFSGAADQPTVKLCREWLTLQEVNKRKVALRTMSEGGQKVINILQKLGVLIILNDFVRYLLLEFKTASQVEFVR